MNGAADVPAGAIFALFGDAPVGVGWPGPARRARHISSRARPVRPDLLLYPDHCWDCPKAGPALEGRHQ
jgi:hypothetical protein